MKHRRQPLFLIVILSLLLFASPALAAQDANDQTFAGIAQEVAQVRHLELLQPVEVTPKTREELAQELKDQLLDDYPEEEQYADQRELVALGLLDPDVDLGDLTVALNSEQIAGYYDPETGEMVVIRESAGESDFTPSQTVTFVHETVHELQDQHFDIDAGPFALEDLSDDQALAATALIEGDATYTMMQYLLARPQLLDRYLTEMQNMQFDTDVLDSAPPIISATLLFPYNAGLPFIETLHDENGYETINDAFRDPPQSTEQILHPEKYLAGEAPVAVTVPDFSTALGDDWTVFDTNTFGEFQMRVMLEQTAMPDEQAADAAAGWGGDTYIVAGTESESAVHWVSQWDAADDASAFARGLALFGSQRWDTDPDYVHDNVIRFNADGVVAQITLDGNTVDYVQAPDAELLETIAGATDATPASSPGATPNG